MAYGRGDGAGFAGGLLAAIFIAFGIGVAGVMIGGGVEAAAIADRHVTVNGLAEREVKANLAIWPMTVTATGDDLALLQSKVDADVRAIEGFLTGLGFDEAEISLTTIRVEDRLSESSAVPPPGGRYLIAQPLRVRSTNVDLVAQASRQLGDITRQGVVLSGVGDPSFVFSRLNEIRADMLEEATMAARDAAQQFAEQAGSQLGGVRNASQGAFEILPRDDVPGDSEDGQIFKRVRVVATVTYQLEP